MTALNTHNIKNGKLLATFKSMAQSIENGLNLESPVSIDFWESRRKEEQKRYDDYMDQAPFVRITDYTPENYEWDKLNVINYFTKWEREDLFLTKDSLRRIRKYEKRNDLKPFEQVLKDIKKADILKRDQEREEEFARRERLKFRNR